jgi:hypothetical protein
MRTRWNSWSLFGNITEFFRALRERERGLEGKGVNVRMPQQAKKKYFIKVSLKIRKSVGSFHAKNFAAEIFRVGFFARINIHGQGLSSKREKNHAQYS